MSTTQAALLEALTALHSVVIRQNRLGASWHPEVFGDLMAALALARSALADAAQPADPMDWPLPCDVKVGHGTIRKGVRLGTLVARMKVLYEMATGEKADEVAARSDAERAERYALFQADLAAGCKPVARSDAAPQQPAPIAAQPEPVGEVRRSHYGGRTRNIGFDVAELYPGAKVSPGDKLYAAPPLPAPIAAQAGELHAPTLMRAIAVCNRVAKDALNADERDAAKDCACNIELLLGFALTADGAAQAGPALVPPGWQMVPVDATVDMRTAFHSVTAEDCALNGDAGSRWRAMLAAAPQAPAEQQCACGDRPASQCPGEWEPGCDLGANEKHARVAPEGQMLNGLTAAETEQSASVAGLTVAPAEPAAQAAEQARLRDLLQVARGALADIAHSDDLTHAAAKRKAARVYAETDDTPAAREAAKPAGWLCPKCGTDRCAAPCPLGHHAALTGDCPMRGEAGTTAEG